ncbi:MAG TPA: FGGY-family carbohydrate kinase [Terracidiphilus sp.]|nr:FGGY-family carbohydrate kinase [Terracidiphilus sp.]
MDDLVAESEVRIETNQGLDRRARVAIDLGAESCRVSLLRWHDSVPRIELIHRIPNGPVESGGALTWPLDAILAGLDEGLRRAAESAPEGVASIGVDGWAVDYVRLAADGKPLHAPFCYRDERTVAAKEMADAFIDPQWLFRHTGAQPLRINTLYQLFADAESGIDTHAPWICLPEYVLHRLGAQRAAEHTNATHTGLVDLDTGAWSEPLIERLEVPRETLSPIVAAGSVIGKLSGELSRLPAFRDTNLVAPACHDTASAIAGISSAMDRTAYICSGTWSLVGTLIDKPCTLPEAMDKGFTNQGAAGGGFLFHANVNGMWILKQCMESWRADGRGFELDALIAQAAECGSIPGTVPVDAPDLLLAGEMPQRLNRQLQLAGCAEIPDVAGNEPLFARVIFESLASRYATVLRSLEELLALKLERIHILGGGSRNRLLTQLTAERTGLPVETGHTESSTVGNFAVQLASAEGVTRESVRQWAGRLK